MNTNKRSKRPKPHSFVQYDPENYYAKLGISPLTPTREIKKIITRKQNDAKKRRRLRAGGKFSEEDHEFNELQRIMESFASSKKREEYDRLNPQSELLTVQWNEYDDWFDKNSQVDFVSAWLIEELGQEKFLPTPGALQLWCPGGLDVELLDFLAQFETQTGIDSQGVRIPEDILMEGKENTENGLQVTDLEEIAGKNLSQDGKEMIVINNTLKNKRPQGQKQGE